MEKLRIATTGLESIPGYHEDLAMELVENWEGEESIKLLSEKIRKAVKPVANTWFTPAYRRKMVKVLTKRACKGLLSE